LPGKVILWVLINQQGTIEKLRIIQGRCWLSEAAFEAVKQWRYSPAMIQGKAVCVVLPITVMFDIR
jgi:periplasmic protein TonB